jgi:uncharacterized membrane protein YeaQ/YmgE (transglycosylase-associated protein family)
MLRSVTAIPEWSDSRLAAWRVPFDRTNPCTQDAADRAEQQATTDLPVAGLAIGALARLIKPGRQYLSILVTLLLGLVGSLIGGAIARALGTGSMWELDVLGFVLAVIAAVLLIGVAEGIADLPRRSVR